MIDTIHFKLKNVSKYPLTRNQYEATTRTGETTVSVDRDTGEFLENSKIRAILHHDSNSLIPLSKRSSFHIASSNYNLSYFYNITSDFISFEFAIPKYMYGTNILQFVKYFSQDCNTIYDALYDFVKGFCSKHFLDVIDLNDIELCRLDLCYNQFFNSRYDALKYLSEQKELLKKFARNSKNDFRTYDTSLLYTTKRYSFKIYHKGTEFKKHDKLELAKRNPTQHQIAELQEISDKILRYEITFRKAQIDYLFEHNELHKKYVGQFIDEQSRSWMRIINRPFYDRSIEFCENSKTYTFGDVTPDLAVDTGMVKFDRAVFATMFNFFWDYVKKYQLRQKLSVFDVVQKIDALNAVIISPC
jgi:hypothetical protein